MCFSVIMRQSRKQLSLLGKEGKCVFWQRLVDMRDQQTMQHSYEALPIFPQPSPDLLRFMKPFP